MAVKPNSQSLDFRSDFFGIGSRRGVFLLYLFPLSRRGDSKEYAGTYDCRTDYKANRKLFAEKEDTEHRRGQWLKGIKQRAGRSIKQRKAFIPKHV